MTLGLSSCNKDDGTTTDDPVLTDLEKAKQDYEDNYIGSAVSDPIWTGSTTGCNSGNISVDVQNKVIQRVNYFRRLVGLPDNVTLNSSQNQKCQESALYMMANNTLTHFPSGGNCYTSGAYDASSHANIAYSKGYPGNKANHSVNAVSGYIEDPGANNLAVGHRAWILYPQLSAMGSGSTWRASDSYATDCLMWGDNLNGAAQSIDFVAYPPASYIPSALVFPRWSFAIYGADFTSATVTMDQGGTNISTNIIHKSAQQGAPDARIAWEPAIPNLPTSITADTEYNVTISGVKNAAKTTYTYTVKVFWVNPSAKSAPSKNATWEIL